jgi:hypothetical protein
LTWGDALHMLDVMALMFLYRAVVGLFGLLRARWAAIESVLTPFRARRASLGPSRSRGKERLLGGLRLARC